MKITRILTVMVGAVAVVAMYGCGSGYISEWPAELEGGDGCKPGEVVPISITTTTEPYVRSGPAKVYQRNSGANTSDGDLSCKGLTPSVSSDMTAIAQSAELAVTDAEGAIISNAPELVDATAGQTCADVQNCIEMTYQQVETGGAELQFNGNVYCDVLDPAGTAVLSFTIHNKYDYIAEMEPGSVGAVTIKLEETSGNAVYDFLNTAVIEEPMDEYSGGPLFNGEPGEVDWDLTWNGTDVAGNEIWPPDFIDTLTESMIVDTAQFTVSNDDNGTAHGYLMFSVDAEYDILDGLVNSSSFVSSDSVNFVHQVCSSDAGSDCGMTTFGPAGEDWITLDEFL